jgi:hypothetical protein
VRQALRATGDTREVVTDGQVRYFGAMLGEQTLTPEAPTFLGRRHFADWVSSATSQAPMPRAAAH